MIREVMCGKNLVALGRVAWRVIMPEPFGKGLLAPCCAILRERTEGEYFKDILDVCHERCSLRTHFSCAA